MNKNKMGGKKKRAQLAHLYAVLWSVTLSLPSWILLFLIVWVGNNQAVSSVCAAGAWSSGQYESAGVHELSSQAIWDAPEEVRAKA